MVRLEESQREGEPADEVPPGQGKLAALVRSALRPTQAQWNDWKWHFQHRITTVAELARFLPLGDIKQSELEAVVRRYPFAITPYYLSLARDVDRRDPILRQSVPSVDECLLSDMGDEDPLEEGGHSPVPGLVHRYPDRALLVTTDICPMLCRFCTRKREWRKGGWIRPGAQFAAALDYVRRTESIRDVIISGGDPLTLPNATLASLLSGLRAIPHVEMIRIGTRYPVVLPQRIDSELCAILDRHAPVWLNTHFNHPWEVTPEAARAVRELLRAGVPVNNQTVLLRGVNDDLETQRNLSRALLRIGVRPYYLYQADEVRGTEHFRTPIQAGLEIVEGLRGHTSGLGVPVFTVDISGGGGKIPLQPNYVLSAREDELLLRNFEGRLFRYRNPRPAHEDADAVAATEAATASDGKNEVSESSMPAPISTVGQA